MDGRSVVDGVDGAHRCLADQPPAALERALQAQLCLTAAHDRCERYRRAMAQGPGGSPEQRGAFGFASTRLILAPEPAWRGIAGRARRGRVPPPAIAGAAVLVVGAGVAAVIATGGIDTAELFGATSPPASVAATASEAPSTAATVEEQPTATPSATPTATVPPTIAPTPAPTVVPTPVPTPPPAQTTYVVQAGDTLAAIAQQFGTTVQSLQTANGIQDPNDIRIGQVLVIP